MISLQKYWLLSALVISLLIGCSSTEPKVLAEPDEEALEESMTDIEPDKKITVLINDRVEYSFIKIDTSWTGTATQYDSNDPMTQKVVQVFTLDPVLSWSDFEDIVRYLKIYTLPDQMEIVDRKSVGITPQSRSYKVTVFDGESTRSYSYFNPEAESTNHWQSQKIATFGSYIATEMKVVQE